MLIIRLNKILQSSLISRTVIISYNYKLLEKVKENICVKVQIIVILKFLL